MTFSRTNKNLTSSRDLTHLFVTRMGLHSFFVLKMNKTYANCGGGGGVVNFYMAAVFFISSIKIASFLHYTSQTNL